MASSSDEDDEELAVGYEADNEVENWAHAGNLDDPVKMIYDSLPEI